MRFASYYLFLSLTLLMLGCSKYDENYFERKADQFVQDKRYTYSFSGNEDWELSSVFEGVRDDSFDFILKSEDQDTLKSLSLYVFKETDEVFIDSYIKNYPKDSSKVELVMKVDTFYCFKEVDGIKEFITGEYNYRYTNFEFAPGELDYYMVHKDSLGSIRGNRLPRLPSLSTELKDSLLKIKK